MNLYIVMVLFYPDRKREVRYAVAACNRYILVVVVKYCLHDGKAEPNAIAVETS